MRVIMGHEDYNLITQCPIIFSPYSSNNIVTFDDKFDILKNKHNCKCFQLKVVNWTDLPPQE